MSNFDKVSDYLFQLQKAITEQISAIDGRVFEVDERSHERGISKVMHLSGALFERAAVNFSKIRGDHLPSSASKRHPEHAGRPFRASGISMIFHPKNPHVPTMHANCRIFQLDDGQDFWFGGGLDLTPYYVYEQDARDWHRVCEQTCHRSQLDYQALKQACDRYFYLPHRKEHRGVGGLFFDDYNLDFEHGSTVLKNLGDQLMEAYLPIVERRKNTHFSAVQRHYQEVRRGVMSNSIYYMIEARALVLSGADDLRLSWYRCRLLLGGNMNTH